MKKRRQGTVVSNKMAKTVVVQVERRFRHPVYTKVVRTQKRFKVHDENNSCKIGDLVEIEETKPISKDKRWRIIKVVAEKTGGGDAK